MKWKLTISSLLVPFSLAAQSPKPVELGVDASLTVLSAEGYSVTQINAPAQSFRVGFFLSDKVSLEPSIGVSYVKPEDGSGLTQYGFAAGLLYHLTASRTAPQVFLKPLVGYSGASFDGESNGSAVVGFGAGFKVHNSNRLAFRASAEYQRRFEDGDVPALNGFGVSAGISFFTR